MHALKMESVGLLYYT